MPSIDTFLQTAYQFIKALFVRVTKRMYRTAAVLMTGAAVVTVIAFNSVSFGGVGKNAASAHREYPDDVELTEMLQSEETTETESLSEFTILASNEESQHLLGQRMEQGIQDELAKEALEVEVIEREVRMQTQQAAQEAEERERRERAVISYSDEDYSVLQKIVQAEAFMTRYLADDLPHDTGCVRRQGKDTGCKCNHQPGEKQEIPEQRQSRCVRTIPVLTGTGWNDQQL